MLESGVWLILPGCEPIAFISLHSFLLAQSSVFAYSRCEKHDSYDAVVAVSWRKIRIALKVT
jgi:hypothetical protein